MDKNTQLPVEVEKSIEDEASEYADSRADHITNIREYSTYHDLQSGYAAGATAYATKLHQVQGELLKTYQDWYVLHKEQIKLKEQATGWRPLLESVLREDKAFGTISNPTINKITKFLYGE